jgi:hypothetical protein
MLHSIEAEIGTDGQVILLEPIRLAHPVRAVATILSPCEPVQPAPAATGTALLALLDGPAFATAPPGDPAEMERIIAANRNVD